MTTEPGEDRAGRAREILADHLPVAHRLFLEWSAGGPASCFGSQSAQKDEDPEEAVASVREAEEAAAIVGELAKHPAEERLRLVATLEPSPELVHAFLMVDATDPESRFEWIGYGVCLERRRRSQGGSLDGGYRREYLEDLVDHCRLGLDVLYRPPTEVDGLMALLAEELNLGVMSYFDLLSGWCCLGRYAHLRGEWKAARTLLGYSESLSDQVDATEHRAQANLELAALSLTEGAIDCLVPLARAWRASERGLTAGTSRRLGMLTAQACLRLSHPLEARRALDWLERHQPPPADSLEGHHEGVVLWLQAQVLSAGSTDTDSARGVLDLAAERFEQIPDGPFRQYWLARLLLDRLHLGLEDGATVEAGWQEELDLEYAPAPVRWIVDDLGHSPDAEDLKVAVVRLEALGPHGLVSQLGRETSP